MYLPRERETGTQGEGDRDSGRGDRDPERWGQGPREEDRGPGGVHKNRWRAENQESEDRDPERPEPLRQNQPGHRSRQR